jgi:hypothetical protein
MVASLTFLGIRKTAKSSGHRAVRPSNWISTRLCLQFPVLINADIYVNGECIKEAFQVRVPLQ